MMQHLKIKSFYGKSENAVCNQIWIALITYCLQVLLQQSVHHEGSLLEIKQTMKTLLFDGFNVFLCALFRGPTRSSKGRRKLNWEAEFQVIEQQFLEGEVSHLDDLTYDPVFTN
jgi:hypothetical protein